MKVDEFVTIYKLLIEQNYYTLPFCMVALYGLLDLLFGFVRKNLIGFWSIIYGLVYATCLIVCLCIVINKRDSDEDLRKDALRIKQYIDIYGAEYETLYLSTITKHFSQLDTTINETRILKVAGRFPNDFSIIPVPDNNRNLFLTLRDTSIMNPHKRAMERLTYIKLKGMLQYNIPVKMDSISKKDSRMHFSLIETVCANHPTEFVIEYPSRSDFRGYVKLIKENIVCTNKQKNI